MEQLKYQLDMLKKPTWRFVNPGEFSKENLIYIQECGKFCSGKNYYTKRSGLDSYLIMFTLSGKGILEYGGERYSLTPESVMFIDCKQYQNYYTDKTAGKWDVIWVHFYGKNVSPYYQRFIEKNSSPVTKMHENNDINEIIENIITISKNYSRDVDNEIIADSLLHALLKECIINSNSANGESPDYIKEISRYIKHNYTEEINLDNLSAEFNISKFHLQRTFKEKIGMSPSKYLLNIRINRAKSLLRSTNMSINEISENIGIESNYFIQLFKNSEGMTPKQYRNNWCGIKK